jgi:hypothetical protein
MLPVVNDVFSWLNIDEFRGLLPLVVESLSKIKVFLLSMASSRLGRKSIFSLVGVISSMMNVLRLSASPRRFLSIGWFIYETSKKIFIWSPDMYRQHVRLYKTVKFTHLYLKLNYFTIKYRFYWKYLTVTTLACCSGLSWSVP